jgi:hypothetical protein
MPPGRVQRADGFQKDWKNLASQQALFRKVVLEASCLT